MTAVKRDRSMTLLGWGLAAFFWLTFFAGRVLECVSKVKDVQFRVDWAAVQGDFPQAW